MKLESYPSFFPPLLQIVLQSPKYKKKIWNDWTTESFCLSVKRDLSVRLNHKEAPFVVYFASIYLTLSYQCMFMFTLINWNKRYDRLSPLIDIPLLRWTKIIKAINFIIRYCTYCFYQSYPPKFRTITQALPHASPPTTHALSENLKSNYFFLDRKENVSSITWSIFL